DSSEARQGKTNQRLRPVRRGKQQEGPVHDVQQEADHPDGGQNRQPHEHPCDQVAAQRPSFAGSLVVRTSRRRPIGPGAHSGLPGAVLARTQVAAQFARYLDSAGSLRRHTPLNDAPSLPFPWLSLSAWTSPKAWRPSPPAYFLA